jgi:hypothetical protein
MVRGYNGPADGKHLFNADDDSEVAVLRQSQVTDMSKDDGSAVGHGSLYSSIVETGAKDNKEVDDQELRASSAQQSNEVKELIDDDDDDDKNDSS